MKTCTTNKKNFEFVLFISFSHYYCYCYYFTIIQIRFIESNIIATYKISRCLHKNCWSWSLYGVLLNNYAMLDSKPNSVSLSNCKNLTSRTAIKKIQRNFSGFTQRSELIPNKYLRFHDKMPVSWISEQKANKPNKS